MTAHLALVLPGGGYPAMGPALWFPALAAEQVGAEIQPLAYPDWRPEGLDLESGRGFYEAVRQRIQDALDRQVRDRVTLVAKSRGTMVLGAIGHELRLPQRVEVIWVTPVFGFDYVRDGAVQAGWRSLIVSGADDQWYDVGATNQVASQLAAEQLVLPGADHSLEVASDVLATVAGIRRLAEASLRFLSDT